jgi:hypothetical protein
VVDTGRLPAAERLALAELQGIARRRTTGRDSDRPREEAVAELHAVTTDPRLLGIAAGMVAAEPSGTGGPVAELLLDAGGDRDVASEHARQTRARLEATGIQYHDPE